MLAIKSEFRNNLYMKKSFFVILALTLILSGCSKSEPLKADDFNILYSDIGSAISMAELKSRKNLDNQQMLETYRSDYAVYSEGLDKISEQLIETSTRITPEDSRAFRNAAEIFSNLSAELQEESKYLANLVCPLVWDDSKQKEIKECGQANLRWGFASSRAIKCSYYLASLEFKGFSEFDFRKVLDLFEITEKDLGSCSLFKDSSSLYGYPRQVGVTWIADRYQKKFLQQDQMFVVEIADGLYAEYTEDLLTDAIYGSWNGSCAVYARYERSLLENGYLLGSIKNGTCF
jgi:hypothetical protein